MIDDYLDISFKIRLVVDCDSIKRYGDNWRITVVVKRLFGMYTVHEA
ncbi:hypothetical protein GLP32_19945 [Photobacterium phosphoreum]|nr:hypothetical protein [Photobacterium phosphoreum]